MTVRRAGRGALRRAVGAATFASVIAAGASPAWAQELPEGPPVVDQTETATAVETGTAGDTATEEPTGDDASIPGGLDFGDAVVVDENGVRWNVDATTGAAQLDDPVIEPVPDEDPSEGTAGTGEPEVGVPVPTTEAVDTADTADSSDAEGGAGTGGDDSGTSGADVPDAGKGRSILVYVAAAAALAAVAALVVVRLRSRRHDHDELIVVEQPIDMAPAHADGSFDAAAYVPTYAGAADAGAYQVGGAAYAQYEAAATGQAPTPPPPQSSARERFASLKATVVDRADKSLTDSGRAKPIARKLEAAGSNTRPGEWLVIAIGMTVGAFCFVTFALGMFFGVAAGIAAAYFSWYRLSMQEAKRRRKFADELPETLQLLAGGLRGGLSMMQAIQSVADEADDPTSSEFQRLMTEARLGRDLAVSLRDLSVRMDSKDFDWVVTAIEIHREVGGDLSSILDRVGNTIRQRNRVLGQVKALSAEGKMSGLILFMLPPGMLAAISALNPEYLQEMIGDSAGQVLLAIATILLAIGGWWLKKLAKFVY